MTIIEAQSTISQSIDVALKQLQPADVNVLRVWLSDYAYKLWDDQIEEDLEAGRLDASIALAEEEYEKGLAMPL